MKATPIKPQGSTTIKVDHLLTIGMIVKNEEHNLPRCLDSMLPILDDPAVELVIVDTGSTDNTVEIAKRYTNKVVFFEWINDFSAARNYGLSHSSGEWLLYIDADQAFDENVTDILDFLKSPEAKEYNRATLRTKNYTNNTFTTYEEHPEPRLVRLYEGSAFQGVIHEYIPMLPPIRDLNIVLHHYGYVNDIIGDKIERNLVPLLEAYEKDPNDPTALMYLHFSHRLYKDKLFYFEKWAEVMEQFEDKDALEYRIYATSGFHFFCEIQDFNKTVEYGNKIIALSNFDDLSVSLTVYADLAEAYLRQSEIKEAINYFEKYIEKYAEYQAGKLISDNASSFLDHVQSYDYQRKVCQLSQAYFSIGDTDSAVKTITKVNLSEMLPEDTKTVIEFYGKLIGNTVKSKTDMLTYEPFITGLSKDSESQVLVLVSGCIFAAKDKRLIASLLLDVVSEAYTRLMLEIYSTEDDASRAAQAEAFVQALPEYRLGYFPLILECIKSHSRALSNIVSKMSGADISILISTLHSFDNDYETTALDFCHEFEVETIKELRFAIEMTKEISAINDDACYLYACLLGNYVTNVYSEEILNDDDINILPFEDQLGYFMYKADASLAAGDKLTYIKYLRRALKVCPDMRNTIKKLSEGIME